MAKIIGNTTAAPNPRPDWNQKDESKADYIKNKPIENGESDGSIQQLAYEEGSEKNPKATGLGAIALGGFRGDKPNNLPDEEDTTTTAEGIQAFAFGAGNHAYGNWSVAGGKDSSAYQQTSIAIGGKVQAGMTEEEFNAYYGIKLNIPGVGANYGKYKEVYLPLTQGTYKISGSLDSVDNGGRYLTYSNGVKYTIHYEIVYDDDHNEIIKVVGDNGYDPVIKDDSGRPYATSYANATAFGSESKALGRNSSAFGDKNIVKGKTATAFGQGNLISKEAYNAIVAGQQNEVSGYNSATFGSNNNANANRALISGSDNIVLQNAEDTLIVGKGLDTRISAEDIKGSSNIKALLGKYNDYLNEDALLVIGNGDSEIDKSTAFEVLKDGRAKVYGTPTDPEDVVTLQKLNDTIAEKVPTSADKQTGSMVQVVPEEQGYITPIASGSASIAFGNNSKSEGDRALVMGNSTRALETATNSSAMGSATISAGHSSFTTGIQTKAVGEYSVALGEQCFTGANLKREVFADIEKTKFANLDSLVAGPWYGKDNGTDEIISTTPTQSDFAIIPVLVNGVLENQVFVYDGETLEWVSVKANKKGYAAVALGSGTGAIGKFSMAVNKMTRSIGESSFAAGIETTAAGKGSFAGGINTTVGGDYSFGFGNAHNVTGKLSATFGQSNTVDGTYNFINGWSNKTAGQYNFIDGNANDIKAGQFNTIIGQKNIIESGSNTYYALVSGYGNVLNGYNGHNKTILGSYIKSLTYNKKHQFAKGVALTLNNDYQSIFGLANTPDSKKMFILANGTTKKDADGNTVTDVGNNIFTVDYTGNVEAKGTISAALAPTKNNHVVRKIDLKSIEDDVNELKVVTGLGLGDTYSLMELSGETNIIKKDGVYPYVNIESVDFVSKKGNESQFIDAFDNIKVDDTVVYSVPESLKNIEGYGIGGNIVDFENKKLHVYYKKWVVPNSGWYHDDIHTTPATDIMTSQFYFNGDIPDDINTQGHDFVEIICNKEYTAYDFGPGIALQNMSEDGSLHLTVREPNDFNFEAVYDENYNLINKEEWAIAADEFLANYNVEIIYKTTEPYTVDISDIITDYQDFKLIGIENKDVTISVLGFDGKMVLQCVTK